MRQFLSFCWKSSEGTREMRTHTYTKASLKVKQTKMTITYYYYYSIQFDDFRKSSSQKCS